MHRRFPILAALALFLLPGTAPAEEAKSGLSYSTMPERATKTQGSLHLRTFNYDQKTPENDGKDAEAEKIWEKYKALAAGTYEQKKDEGGSMKVQKPTLPEKPAAAPPAQEKKPAAKPGEAVPASGITGLVQDYYKTRAQQGQMRTLVINKAEEKPAE